jgi:hypothetical protein
MAITSVRQELTKEYQLEFKKSVETLRCCRLTAVARRLKHNNPERCSGLLLKLFTPVLNLPTRHDEVATAILLVAVFRCFAALRTFLPVADRVHPSGIDTQ